ncbi:RNA-binding domain-containing protein, partial [Aeromonas hydrophila]
PIYNNHSTIDIEGVIRRSEIELASYELKQGILQLHGEREENPQVTEKIINTICAMANNGKGSTGKIIIGVTDKEQHATLISQLDRIEPLKIGSRYVVGVKREATRLNLSLEHYFAKWATAIRNSELSEPLKGQVLSTMDFNDFYGLGILIISVPPQQNVSSVGDNVYWRDADNTKLATGIQVARIAQRF